MIKNLWNKFVFWLFSWQEEKKEKTVVDHCGTHSRYKKSCMACRQVVGAM